MKKLQTCMAALAISLATMQPASAQIVSPAVVITEVAGQQVITGTADYDQVDYAGAAADYSFVLNADGTVSVTKPDGNIDRLIDIDGVWFLGEEVWYSVEALSTAATGNQTVTGDPDEYSQVDYNGSASDYTFTRNSDVSVSVVKPNGSTDTLVNIDGVWFRGEAQWYPINDLVVTTNQAITYTGSADAYDQVDYAGNAADYIFTVSGDSVLVERRSTGVVDTLTDIDGIWFQGEAQWYDLSSLTEQTSQTYRGTAEYDQVDYSGSLADYTFTQNTDGSVSVERPDSLVDTLIDIDGIWFGGEEQWYSIEDAIEQSQAAPVVPVTTPTGPQGGDNTADFGTIVATFAGGRCVYIAEGSTLSSANGVVATCDSSSAQNYAFASVGDAYQIRAQHSDKCLGVEGASQLNVANVSQLDCSTQPHMLWKIEGTGDRRRIIASHSEKCLNIEGGWAARNTNLIQYTCTDSANDLWRIDAPLGAGSISINATTGIWEGPYSLSIVPSGAANMADGKIMTWSAAAKFAFSGGRGNTYTSIFDPASNLAEEMNVISTGHDMFCPGTATTADGRLVVTGGNASDRTSILDLTSGEWSTGPRLQQARGYNAMTTLPNGDILNLGGSWSGGVALKNGEVWNEASGWTTKPGLADADLNTADVGGLFRSDNHMWLFSAPNGSVFHAGPSIRTHWIDVDGAGDVAQSVQRGNDTDSMNGTAVMYDVGKLLTMGGAPNYTNSDAHNRAYVFDINGARSAVSVSRTDDMAFARAYHNSVVLPSGEVVVVGGQSRAVNFSDDRSIFTTEIWNPETEQFTEMADMTVPRNYHSVALLMKDGRVFATGGGLCGSCTTNHADAEIFTPPYLLNNDGTPATRPVISNVPASATYGQVFSVRVDVDRPHTWALVRTSAATHSVNNDERRIPIVPNSRNGFGVTLEIPTNRGVVTPGNYFLFAMSPDGVPSVAETINIQ